MARTASAFASGYRTLEARPNTDSLIKPGELVDLIEVTPLTLVDRRIYNQLLDHAWDRIDQPVTHVISKSALRGSHNSNDRVGESIERLMMAIVRVAVTRDGASAVERVQLLGGNVETLSRNGLLEYEIPQRLRRILQESTVFARLQRRVMFALTSKYALTLYEMVQKRGNLRWRASERFTLAGLRGILGVPKGRLTTWSNLRLRAIDPAVQEVNRLSDYQVEILPSKTGRSVTHVELHWRRKDRSGAGPDTSPVAAKPRPAWLDRQGPPLAAQTYELARRRHGGYDIYTVEAEWRRWAKDKPPAKDPDRAFLAFLAKFAAAHPL
ncbi:replication initiation protein [Parasedimentitalea psychrophila]|uniref:Replication initiation protein n=1 Tax=Parasedimentitalea psychrophila TaxID=2997337 RepID=A0A9Y2P955_9RHOB|nr:replication initiation protein [Parasedimentitalea psychrophila]WIY27723.1 replication initiation protein [Parasedimentitalea psychrophila]